MRRKLNPIPVGALCKRAIYGAIALIGIVFFAMSTNAAKVQDFIPKESALYLQLRDLDEVYAEIELSENWQKMQTLLPGAVPEMQQGLTMGLTLFGTDMRGLIKTVGYRTGLAMWQNEAGETQIGLLVHSGGNIGELQRLTKIIAGMMGMNEGTLIPEAGIYRKNHYSTLETPEHFITYGFVDEFLVAGIGKGSFEKLIDTFRKKASSIAKNPDFAKATKKFGAGELTTFVDVPQALSMLKDLSKSTRKQLEFFEHAYARLNLLEGGKCLQVYTQFTPPDPLDKLDKGVTMFLKEGSQLRTLKALSGEEELFVALAPPILEKVWQFAHAEIENNSTEETYTALSLFEENLHLDLETDVMAGLTGELALSVSDLTQFDPEVFSGLNVEFDGALAIDFGDVETQGSLIFNSSNPSKLNLIGNSILNVSNASVSQTDYSGTTVSEFAENVYHCKSDGLFLLSFSEDQIYALVDTIQQKKRPDALKQLPKTPTVVAQLNLARLLEATGSSLPPEVAISNVKEMSPLLAWLSVKGNEAVVEAVFSEEEAPLEVLANLAPFIAWNLQNQQEEASETEGEARE